LRFEPTMKTLDLGKGLRLPMEVSISPEFDYLLLVFSNNFAAYISHYRRILIVVFIAERLPIRFPFLFNTSIDSTQSINFDFLLLPVNEICNSFFAGIVEFCSKERQNPRMYVAIDMLNTEYIIDAGKDLLHGLYLRRVAVGNE
jgi:hypothetical protein